MGPDESHGTVNWPRWTRRRVLAAELEDVVSLSSLTGVSVSDLNDQVLFGAEGT